MEKISVVISVVDQEVSALPRALSSVVKIASEIILIDMTSSDKLFEIAREFHAKVYKHNLVPYVEIVRNLGITKAEGKWILILDPDEKVSNELVAKIKRIILHKEADYYRLPRKNIIFGKWIKHSRWWSDHNVRFFKKDMVTWTETIHGVPITQGDGLDLEPKEELAIVHHHYDSIATPDG